MPSGIKRGHTANQILCSQHKETVRVIDDCCCFKSLSFGVACHSALDNQNTAYQLPCPLLIQKPYHVIFLFRKDSGGAPHTQDKRTWIKRTWKLLNRLSDLEGRECILPTSESQTSAAPNLGGDFTGQDEPHSVEKSEQEGE